eukprot:6396722-Prymnesium_polylepis.1
MLRGPLGKPSTRARASPDHGRNALARSQSHHPPLRPPKWGRRRGPQVTHAKEGVSEQRPVR